MEDDGAAPDPLAAPPEHVEDAAAGAEPVVGDGEQVAALTALYSDAKVQVQAWARGSQQVIASLLALYGVENLLKVGKESIWASSPKSQLYRWIVEAIVDLEYQYWVLRSRRRRRGLATTEHHTEVLAQRKKARTCIGNLQKTVRRMLGDMKKAGAGAGAGAGSDGDADGGGAGAGAAAAGRGSRRGAAGRG
jgi:hypothetical protein